MHPSREHAGAFLVSVLLHVAGFYLVRRHGHYAVGPTQDRKRALRRQSWIVTTIASGLSTLVSLPYVAKFLLAGGDASRIVSRDAWSDAIHVAFIGYLVSDLALGVTHYRANVTLVTGYIHHTAYIAMLLCSVELSHIFALAAILELPTFVLGLQCQFPALRRDEVFASIFFIIRIVFHLGIIATFATHRETYKAARLLAGPFPLHVWWFRQSVAGIVRRRRVAQTQSAPPTPEPAAAPTLAVVPVAVPKPMPAHSAIAAAPASPKPRFVRLRPPLAPIRMAAGIGPDSLKRLRLPRYRFARTREVAREPVAVPAF